MTCISKLKDNSTQKPNWSKEKADNSNNDDIKIQLDIWECSESVIVEEMRID